MKKINVLAGLLISTSVIFAGCSLKDSKEIDNKEDSVLVVEKEDIKKDKRLGEVNKNKKEKAELDSLLAVVVQASESSEYITLESKQRNIAGAVTSVKKVNNNKDFVFYEGDLVRVYYSVSNGAFNNFSILSIEYAELIGYDKDEKIDYYQYPILSVSSGGKTIQLSEKNSALTHDIINNFKWSLEEIPSFNADYRVMSDEEIEFEFDSKKGALHDSKNKIWLQLDDYFSGTLKSALKNE